MPIKKRLFPTNQSAKQHRKRDLRGSDAMRGLHPPEPGADTVRRVPGARSLCAVGGRGGGLEDGGRGLAPARGHALDTGRGQRHPSLARLRAQQWLQGLR